jgi:hypothetical protein
MDSIASGSCVDRQPREMRPMTGYHFFERGIVLPEQMPA